MVATVHMQQKFSGLFFPFKRDLIALALLSHKQPFQNSDLQATPSLKSASISLVYIILKLHILPKSLEKGIVPNRVGWLGKSERIYTVLIHQIVSHNLNLTPKN